MGELGGHCDKGNKKAQEEKCCMISFCVESKKSNTQRQRAEHWWPGGEVEETRQ